MAIDIAAKIDELTRSIVVPDGYSLETTPSILTARFGPNIWLGHDQPLDLVLVSVLGNLTSKDIWKRTKQDGAGVLLLSDGQIVPATGTSGYMETYRGMNKNFRINAHYSPTKCGIYVGNEPLARNYR